MNRTPGRRPVTTLGSAPPISQREPKPCPWLTSSTSTPKPSTAPTVRNSRSAGRGRPACSTGRTWRAWPPCTPTRCGRWPPTVPRRAPAAPAHRTSRSSRSPRPTSTIWKAASAGWPTSCPSPRCRKGSSSIGGWRRVTTPTCPRRSSTSAMGTTRSTPPSCAGRWKHCSTAIPTSGPDSTSWRRGRWSPSCPAMRRCRGVTSTWPGWRRTNRRRLCPGWPKKTWPPASTSAAHRSSA